jgi:hypothetical protein
MYYLPADGIPMKLPTAFNITQENRKLRVWTNILRESNLIRDRC